MKFLIKKIEVEESAFFKELKSASDKEAKKVFEDDERYLIPFMCGYYISVVKTLLVEQSIEINSKVYEVKR